MAAFGQVATLGAATRTNSTLTFGSAPSADHIIILVMDIETVVPTPPAGFEVLAEANHAANINRLRVFWKRAGGSEGTSYTITHASTWTNCVGYTVTSASTTARPKISIPNQGTGTTATARGVTPRANNAHIAMPIITFGDMGLTAPPGGTTPTFTERYDSTNNVYLSEGTLATAAATGDKTAGAFGSGSQDWMTALIVVEDSGYTEYTTRTAPTFTGGTVVQTITSPQTVTLPAHSTGDLLGITVVWQSNTALPVTTPTGWERTGRANQTTPNPDLGVAMYLRKAASGSETNPSFVHTATTSTAGITFYPWKVAVSTWAGELEEALDKWPVYDIAAAASTWAGPAWPATYSPNAMPISFVATADDNTLSVAGTGWTAQLSGATGNYTGGADQSHGVATATALATAGTTPSAITWTQTALGTDTWAGCSFYIRGFGTAGTAGTATPSVIALALALPAPTKLAGSTTSPAVIARALTTPTATASGGTGAAATPGVVPLALTVPAATASASSGATATPNVIALALALPTVTVTTGSTTSPAAIALAAVLPAPSATGGGSATATPAVIARSLNLPAATTAAGGTRSPAAITLAVNLPAVTTSAGGTRSPGVIPLTVTIPAASASGASTGTATPASITTTITMPAPTPLAGSRVTPNPITLAVTMPVPTVSGGGARTPAVIPLTIAMPAATASGSTASTATPNAIALVTTVPKPTNVHGYRVNPATIALAVSLAAVAASGTPTDATPITITIRDQYHTVTAQVVNHVTIRDTDHTATVREQRL